LAKKKTKRKLAADVAMQGFELHQQPHNGATLGVASHHDKGYDADLLCRNDKE